MEKKLVFTKKRSDEIIRLPSTEYSDMDGLVKVLKKEYDFIIGYIPEGYNVAFLLQKDDKDDSRNDEWSMVFFGKSMDMGEKSNETITLDNLENMDLVNGEEKFELVKTIKGNYEDVINSSVDLIKKYRDSDTEEN